jgi:HEAT repeat protein
LKEDDPFVLSSILRSLKQLRIKEARPEALRLLSHLDTSVRREAVSVLGYLQDTENLPQLISTAANDADAEVRRTAIGALVYADGSQVAKALMSGLLDEHWQVRVESAKGLGRLHVESAIESLVTAIGDSMWQVQEKAAEALGKIGSIKAVSALGSCLKNPIGNLRKAAVAALGEIAHPDCMPLVDIALNDNDPDVRKLARWAKDQIEASMTVAGE